VSSQENGIKLVCFDLGGVIVRICRSWEEGCARAGLPLRTPDRRAETVNERKSLARAFQTGRIDLDAYARGLSEILHGLYTPDEIKSIHRAWIIEEYEGVHEVVDSIHAAGLETACLSNTDHAHWNEQIRTLPVLRKLRSHMASHMLGLQKPDVEIFAEAERRLRTPGASILFFDDLEDNVLAARAAGWNAVQVDPMARTDRQIARALRERGVAIDDCRLTIDG
jgi:HAD superfamily hydrolase (TIGR01509 family)